MESIEAIRADLVAAQRVLAKTADPKKRLQLAQRIMDLRLALAAVRRQG